MWRAAAGEVKVDEDGAIVISSDDGEQQEAEARGAKAARTRAPRKRKQAGSEAGAGTDGNDAADEPAAKRSKAAAAKTEKTKGKPAPASGDGGEEAATAVVPRVSSRARGRKSGGEVEQAAAGGAEELPGAAKAKAGRGKVAQKKEAAKPIKVRFVHGAASLYWLHMSADDP